MPLVLSRRIGESILIHVKKADLIEDETIIEVKVVDSQFNKTKILIDAPRSIEITRPLADKEKLAEERRFWEILKEKKKERKKRREKDERERERF